MDRSELKVKQLVRVIADGRVGVVEQIGSFSDHAYVAFEGNVTKVAFSELEDASGRKKAASDGPAETTPSVTQETLLKTFQKLDVNKDGTISRNELKNVLQKLDAVNWSDAELEKLFLALDLNSDGRIQWEEFVEFAYGKDQQGRARAALIGDGAPVHKLTETPPLILETDWFSDLFGFSESDYVDVQRWLRVSVAGFTGSPMLESLVNKQQYAIGTFTTPSLADLRNEGATVELPGKLKVKNVVGGVDELIAADENRHSTFQVASQFNCLETMSPTQYPEEGVGCYAKDKTQGPACSIACGPATVFRNYFVAIDADGAAAKDTHSAVQRGQTWDAQIDNLAGVARVLGNDPPGKLFQVRTGWVLADDEQLELLGAVMDDLKKKDRLDEFRSALRVGVQRDTQVTSYKFG